MSPDKSTLDTRNPQSDLEKNPDEGVNKLIEQYPETFCSTNIEDIKIAQAGSVQDSYKSNFMLHSGTYVTHQGVTIFRLNKPNGRGQDVILTKNPMILDELQKAGYSTMKINDGAAEAGTPLAHGATEGAAPYIKNFFKSKEADNQNRMLDRNRKIERIDKDVQYMNAVDFEKRYGYTAEKYNSEKYNSGFLDQTP